LSSPSPTTAAAVPSLVNTGVLLLNDSQLRAAERTLIVLGIARSGTTMVAGALHHMGVDMGMGQRMNSVFEDMQIGALLDNKDYTGLAAVIEQRNRAHAVWGWKRPDAIDHLDQIEPLFRSPEYIVVFRDLFAIANRNRLSVRADLLANMRDVQARYDRLLAFLGRNTRRTLLVSYEKAMLDRTGFVRELAGFAQAGDACLQAAEAHIRKDDPGYLKFSRNWGGLGHLTVPAHNIIGGWAYVREHSEPAMVEIAINGRAVATLRADLPIEEVKKRGHATGLCGFHLSLPRPWQLQDGDIVTARIAGDAAELFGSPWVFKRPDASVRTAAS
jgi:hypothetical protein